jgi:hypothetical protein
VKVKNGDLLAGPYNILNRWKNYLSQLLNVHTISDVKQIETYIVEPLVPDTSPFHVENVIAKQKSYKSSFNDQIPTEVIQA